MGLRKSKHPFRLNGTGTLCVWLSMTFLLSTSCHQYVFNNSRDNHSGFQIHFPIQTQQEKNKSMIWIKWINDKMWCFLCEFRVTVGSPFFFGDFGVFKLFHHILWRYMFFLTGSLFIDKWKTAVTRHIDMFTWTCILSSEGYTAQYFWKRVCIN